MPDIENPASLVFGRDSWRGPHSYRCKCYKNLLKHPDPPRTARGSEIFQEEAFRDGLFSLLQGG